MITLDRVTFFYQGSSKPILHDVSLTVPEGELCLVIGPTGSGKSTLLQLVNGLAPHFTGGHLIGTVVVGGLDTRVHPPRDFAEIVGVVGQNPVAGFVTDRVEDELAYSMEQLGIAPPIMRKRVEEIIDLLALDRIRHRSLSELSSGEQQRVAIGAALTAQPRILILDEPTSALDPSAAEEVLGAILRLVHDLGVTVLLAEHRLERVIQYADSIVRLGEDGSAEYGECREMLASSSIAPPIVELGRLAGWDPLPLSIRDARRVAQPLRDRLCDHPTRLHADAGFAAQSARPPALRAKSLRVEYGRVTAIAGIDLALVTGQLTALMGRNGSGKSSLLWALQGTGQLSGGRVRLIDGAGMLAADPRDLASQEAISRIALVPQNPADLLYLESVIAECREADRAAGVEPGTAEAILGRLWPGQLGSCHPRDLSEGQRLALVLALQLAAAPAVLLLDEPTRGLDYDAKRRLGTVLSELVSDDTAILLSSHDVEFVASNADRVVVLAEGEIITDGQTHSVLTASPSFAPQVSKILRPLSFSTVDAVREALGVQP